MSSPYDLDEMTKSLENIKVLLGLQVDVECILQILLLKGHTTREEIAQYREAVKQISPYKESAEYVENVGAKVEFYKNNQEAYLKDLLAAKMAGKIK